MSTRNNFLAGIGSRILEGGHRTLLFATGGRWPHRIGGMATVELHVTGRKSGKRYSTLLTTPIHDENRVILIASKGGHDEHPDWYKNLVANPEVEITENGRTRKMRARTATGAERAELWPQVVAVYKGYAGYQKQTEREIPVVICEPVDGK
jgi:deazaflavin-dependent oxidoreductase (nitroreductase family)